MIYLKNISDSIINAHWKYFKESEGYSNLLRLSNDTLIPRAEKEYFLRLTNESLLKSIIVGKPEQLRNEILYYQTTIRSQIPLLTVHQEFLSVLTWDEGIYPQINTIAEKKTDKTTVTNKKQFLYDFFLNLIHQVNDPNLIIKFEQGKLTIKNIKILYSGLKTYFKTKLGEFYDRISSVFDYNDFIKEKEEWYAYKLTSELGVNVCPYCNRNYIHTSITEHGRTRAELDHFYPKSKYPFLSISLYNLIPSCHVCNSNLKKSRDFYSQKHLHPFENDFINDFCFEINYLEDTIDNIVPDIKAFEIKLRPDTDNPDVIDLVNNSNATFQISKLHNHHKDIAQELLARSIHYNKSKIEELKSILGTEAGIDEEFLKRVIIGNYADIGSFGKRPLAKYSYDILSKTDLKDNLDL
ncbi:HNH endonuclease [Sphingobacterium faecale]|uniref:HNH endonuclease n=1 Tax=Sphingobacterium faecale TaxID=2803775 RepID=A0ABS1R8E5_9SPHI|nr:HNH endonuclease domain-containing protein [Sphingobacterium faecale]MBL1410967.1 hypothetical protein [Sphingobacterium faecale]